MQYFSDAKVVSSDVAGCAVVVFEGIITTMEDDCATAHSCCAAALRSCATEELREELPLPVIAPLLGARVDDGSAWE